MKTIYSILLFLFVTAAGLAQATFNWPSTVNTATITLTRDTSYNSGTTSTAKYKYLGPQESTYPLTGVAVTAGNFAAQEALHDALTAAFAGVIISASLKKHSFGNVEVNATTTSLSPLNQRENKWLCRCKDDVTNELVRFEIPGADLTLIDADNPDYMDPDDAAYTALASAIHDYAKNPETGNALTLMSAQFVGRNT